MTTKPLLVALALAAPPALAQTPDQDVRCVIAGNAFAQSEKDPAKRQLAFATSLFFAGRVDARLSPAQLKAQVATQGASLTVQTVAQTMNACAQSFQAKERAMQAIGQEVARARGVPPAAKPAPAKK